MLIIAKWRNEDAEGFRVSQLCLNSGEAEQVGLQVGFFFFFKFSLWSESETTWHVGH
jgi:hypothetical protein